MPADKYSAVWVSYSSMGDFLKCPRLYYLRNIYKNEKGKKVTTVGPALSLGSVVHAVIEGLAKYKVEERFQRSLLDIFEEEWKKCSGEIGGFTSIEEEAEAKARGRAMIERVEKNPRNLKNKTVRLKESANKMPPNFFLSEDENIILCGKIDWLEYIESDNSIKVIDFKTGRHEEKEDSLQLPIYRLLLDALQKRAVSGAAYWYLDKDDGPIDASLPAVNDARERVLTHALKIKRARAQREFHCSRGEQGCFSCKPFLRIINGEAKFVGIGEYGQELYIA